MSAALHQREADWVWLGFTHERDSFSPWQPPFFATLFFTFSPSTTFPRRTAQASRRSRELGAMVCNWGKAPWWRSHLWVLADTHFSLKKRIHLVWFHSGSSAAKPQERESTEAVKRNRFCSQCIGFSDYSDAVKASSFSKGDFCHP